ncbi:hypothetical protein Bbelb_053680 [Branchiostoma belcheri]|nr:hypothetical protein Bbelb_053680 [Branchiostoma belcheri]
MRRVWFFSIDVIPISAAILKRGPGAARDHVILHENEAPTDASASLHTAFQWGIERCCIFFSRKSSGAVLQSEALKKVSDRHQNVSKDHNMSNVTPYLSSCVLLFCQPVFSDHYTAHIMYEVPPLVVLTLVVSTTRVCTPKKRAKAHSCRHNAEYPMHDCTPNTVPETTQTGTVIKPRARRKDYNSHRLPCVLPLDHPHPSERPNRAKEHSSRDGDEHNMHDEKITPLAMCVTARLPLPECAKEHSSRDSDEHNMHDERSHRSPCVLPLDCPYPSVPKNTQAGTVTNTTCTTKDHTARHVCYRSTAPTRVYQRTLKQGQ